jgi:predicted nucleic acid-binding protein
LKLFVDTSGWVALFNQRDRNHQKAKELWERLVRERPSLYTSDYIIDETITLLRARGGFEVAKRGGQNLFGSQILSLLKVSYSELLESWEFFQKYPEHGFSFTDCTSFVLMKKNGIESAFTFDRHFSMLGFSTLS